MSWNSRFCSWEFHFPTLIRICLPETVQVEYGIGYWHNWLSIVDQLVDLRINILIHSLHSIIICDLSTDLWSITNYVNSQFHIYVKAWWWRYQKVRVCFKLLFSMQTWVYFTYIFVSRCFLIRLNKQMLLWW